MSRFALCETDHASATGNIRDCVLGLSDDTEILRNGAMMTSSVVLASCSMKLRNFGCAETQQGKTTHTFNANDRIITRNNLGPHISKQSATQLFALRGCHSPSTFVVVATCDIGDEHVEHREDENDGH
jgi:hypothetical protein